MILCPYKGMSDVDGTVVGLQGNPVSATAPNDEEVLTWVASAGEWQPKEVQVMEPWVGTPNTQRQLILKRVPFVVSVTLTGAGSTWVSTGVTYSLPTGASLTALINNINRNTTNFLGATHSSAMGGASNISGTISTNVSSLGGVSSGTGTGSLYRWDVSGSDVTLEIGFSSGAPGDVIDIQGHVDMMVM
jgi:hypothetical protein